VPQHRHVERNAGRNVSHHRWAPDAGSTAGWILQSLAPWAVGGILLVSFTANAGPRLDAFDAPVKRMWTLGGGTTVLKLPVPRAAKPRPESPEKAGASRVEHWFSPPSLTIGERGEAPPLSALLFVDRPDFLPAGPLQDRAGFEQRVAAIGGRFVQENVEGTTLTALRGTTSAEAIGGASPSLIATMTAATPDGRTPAVRKAVALASATPAPVEPQSVATPPVARQASPARLAMPANGAAEAPRYAGLIEPEDMSREQRCLAEAIYFEARSEPAAGQAAVAQVVLNRVK
jgi:hypothetical protein